MKLSNIEGSPWNGFIWEKVDVEVIQHIRNHAFKPQINIPCAKCAVCTLIVIVYVDRADKTANFIKCEEHLMKHFVIKNCLGICWWLELWASHFKHFKLQCSLFCQWSRNTIFSDNGTLESAFLKEIQKMLFASLRTIWQLALFPLRVRLSPSSMILN